MIATELHTAHVVVNVNLTISAVVEKSDHFCSALDQQRGFFVVHIFWFGHHPIFIVARIKKSSVTGVVGKHNTS